MNSLCHSKEKALDMSQGAYLVLNALYHLAFRFNDIQAIKRTVLDLLQQITVMTHLLTLIRLNSTR